MNAQIKAFLAELSTLDVYDVDCDSSETFQGMYIDPYGSWIDKDDLAVLVSKHFPSEETK